MSSASASRKRSPPRPSPTSRARRSPPRNCRSGWRARRADVIVDLIEDAVRECIAKSGIDAKALKGIGIGVPGIVDPRSGQSHASSVFGEREMPIAPLLEKRMGMPVKIEKPAHLVALAESWFGYAQRNRSFAVVTVDQTAGLGLWYEDDLLRGASTLGPAFGHIKVGKDERPCECGQKGCLNAYVSAVALREEARSVLAPEFLATAIAGNNFIAALSDAAQSRQRRWRWPCWSGRARCSASACRTSSTCSIRKR